MDIDDSVVKERVLEKLEFFNMPPYNELNKKTQEKLLEVEKFICKSEDIVSQSLNIIKDNSLTKSNIAKNVSFSRRTLYNDKVLVEYIEKCSKIKSEQSSESELKNLHIKYQNLKNLYDNILESLIDMQDLKLTNKKLNKENIQLEQNNVELNKLIIEKDKTISQLQNKLIRNNISLLKTKWRR